VQHSSMQRVLADATPLPGASTPAEGGVGEGRRVARERVRERGMSGASGRAGRLCLGKIEEPDDAEGADDAQRLCGGGRDGQ